MLVLSSRIGRGCVDVHIPGVSKEEALAELELKNEGADRRAHQNDAAPVHNANLNRTYCCVLRI